MTYQPLTAVEVEAELVRLSAWLEDLTNGTDEVMSVAELGEQAGTAEVAYKQAYAATWVGTDGTTSKRDQVAIQNTADLLRARRYAEAQLAARKEALTTVRDQMGTLRTIAANVRAQT